MTPTIDQAIQLWKERVLSHEEDIDPNQEEDWRSMALGFGFGLMFSFEQVHEFLRELHKQNLY